MFNLVWLGLTLVLFARKVTRTLCFKMVHVDIVNCLVHKNNRWKPYLWFNVLKTSIKFDIKHI